MGAWLRNEWHRRQYIGAPGPAALLNPCCPSCQVGDTWGLLAEPSYPCGLLWTTCRSCRGAWQLQRGPRGEADRPQNDGLLDEKSADVRPSGDTYGGPRGSDAGAGLRSSCLIPNRDLSISAKKVDENLLDKFKDLIEACLVPVKETLQALEEAVSLMHSSGGRSFKKVGTFGF
ncbi:hypothetical protein NDU88_002037 [Pleurodeles waltl]|uniref:Uncharacterized protein n=1 Tax=Pleurodeles waltl TaxID=8319 RepID=A0AAV7KTH6_PLEWA|nr:hypothetical protein NDU88_002037 [Pleurodeles waltl]